MDTIDFNKHDIDIFINLAKIVYYGTVSEMDGRQM